MSIPLVLTVDDEPDITTLLSYQLKRAGYRVRVASTGKAALDVIAEETPDLILLDLMLPDMDGFSICEVIRGNAATVDIPIFIISGWTPGDSRRIGKDQGISNFIAKPFCSRDLIRRIKEICGDSSNVLCL